MQQHSKRIAFKTNTAAPLSHLPHEPEKFKAIRNNTQQTLVRGKQLLKRSANIVSCNPTSLLQSNSDDPCPHVHCCALIAAPCTALSDRRKALF
jgi:hypothetical protein